MATSSSIEWTESTWNPVTFIDEVFFTMNEARWRSFTTV